MPAAEDPLVTISDDEWIAAARNRAAAGSWERPAGDVLAELRRHGVRSEAAGVAALKCPYCESHPLLARMQRYELQAVHPLWYCNSCYGFWATGDALVRGVADPGTGHPALEASRAPRRCRACFGHLKPDHTCARCGKSLPRLNCPACARTMERTEEDGVQLDQCGHCTGTWFDTGEIAAVHKLVPAQGLAAGTVDEHAADDEPPAWLTAAMILSRVFLPL